MKKDDLRIEKMFELRYTQAAELFEGKRYPWEALPELSAFIERIGRELPPSEYEERSPTVWIHRSARVYDSAFLSDHILIGPETEVRHCAFLRGSVLVGRGCVIGNSCELKNSILFDSVQVPHYNYIGDSILGYRSHMGAASLTSNVKSDRRPVFVHAEDGEIETGLKKLGAILSDCVEVGCGSVLNPGCCIGKNTNIYPLSSVRGTVDADSIYKREGEIARKRTGEKGHREI